MKRKFTLILAALLLLTYTSCGSGTTDPVETTSSGETTTVEETKDEYVFPELDMGGKEFVMLQRDVNYDS